MALAFILDYYARHREGPSLNEIGNALHCTRTRAQAAVRQLAKEGRIHRTAGKARGIRPISAREEAIRLLLDDGWTVLDPVLDLAPLPGGTNTSLPLPPELDHIPDVGTMIGDKGYGAEHHGVGRDRKRA